MATMGKMEKARARMIIEHVFFASVILSTPYVENKDIPTAATDMEKVYYNPEFIESLELKVVMFVISHEIMHVVLKHGLRRGSRTVMTVSGDSLWNIACDYAINIILKDSGFQLWEHAYVDEKYRGMSAEEIYDDLLKNSRTIKMPPNGIGNDLLPPPTNDPAKINKIDQTITTRIVQATTIARAQGKMPGHLDRIVNGIINPPLPWQELLRDFAMRVVQDEESWSRRNRRYKPILPGRHSRTMGEIVLIGDTSGSMPDDTYPQIGEELGYIVASVKPERVRVIWADDEECSNEEVFEPGEAIVLHPKGGGGTDMRLALNYVKQYDPLVVILVTDCLTPWPDEPTSYPLIVCATTKSSSPEWAFRVPMKIGA